MKKSFYRTASVLLSATFLLSPTLAFAEDYIPFSIQAGGTGASTVEEAKENLEIPEVVQTAGTSETVVMSQKAVTDAIAAGSGGGIVVTQASGQSTTNVMSQKAVTDAISSAQTPIVQSTGTSLTDVMSQSAVTAALAGAAQNTIVQTTGTGTAVVMSQKAVTDVMDTVIPKTSIVSGIGTSTTSVMSQKAVTDAILTAQTIFNMIWPVGSIYMSINSTNPGSLFGGTWVQWCQGRVPVGVYSAETEFQNPDTMGGSKTHNHDWRIAMNWYYGDAVGENIGSGAGAYVYTDNRYDGWARTGLSNVDCPVNNNNTTSSTVRSSGTKYSQGNTSQTSTFPRYTTCYMWKRTA